jgi:hypothetical protein
MKKKDTFLKKNEEPLALLVQKSLKEHVLTGDEDLTAQWENVREKIVQFYINTYVDILIEHGNLFTKFNELSLALLQHQVYSVEELTQAKELLHNQLQKLFENKA